MGIKNMLINKICKHLPDGSGCKYLPDGSGCWQDNYFCLPDGSG